MNGLDDHYAHGKIAVGQGLLKSEALNPLETVLIVDTDHYCEVASEMGISSILIKNGHNSDIRLNGCGKPIYNELKEIII